MRYGAFLVGLSKERPIFYQNSPAFSIKRPIALLMGYGAFLVECVPAQWPKERAQPLK